VEGGNRFGAFDRLLVSIFGVVHLHGSPFSIIELTRPSTCQRIPQYREWGVGTVGIVPTRRCCDVGR